MSFVITLIHRFSRRYLSADGKTRFGFLCLAYQHKKEFGKWTEVRPFLPSTSTHGTVSPCPKRLHWSSQPLRETCAESSTCPSNGNDPSQALAFGTMWSCRKACTALAAVWLLLLKTTLGTCQDSLDQADCHASRCWYIAPCNLEMQKRLDHCPDAIEVFQVGQWSSPRKFGRSLHRWESLPFPS